MVLPITFVDVLVLLAVVVSCAYAAWRGFMSEVLGIFAWAAAAFATLYFGPWLIPLMRGVIETPWVASLAAYAGIFLVVVIPLSFIGHRFSETVKHSPIGPLDRAGGVAFGIVRGLVLVGLAYLAFSYFVPLNKHPEWIRNARLLPVVQSTSQVLLSVVPDHPEDFAYIPHHEEVKQAPAKIEQKAANPPDMSSGSFGGHDPMAELIRRNEASNHVPAATPEPVRQKKTAKATKSYGASDRQALDKLVESGGNGNR